MVAVQVTPLFAALTAFSTAVLFFPALRISAKGRAVVFVLLATLILLTPWIIPPEARIPRFLVAIYAGVLVLKLWDLHLGAARQVNPRFTEFLAFLANLPSLVHRRIGSEPQPTPRENAIIFAKSLLGASLGLLAFNILLRLDWGSTPFLVEHVLKASVFFVGATAFFRTFAAVARAFGGYAPEPMNRPYWARTPADFWRRYNRWIGEGMREDLFLPMGGRRHPVLATLAVFAVSGILHEYLFFASLGSVQGFQFSFFSLQGAAVAMTLRARPGRIVGIGGTFAFNALSSVLFFASFHNLAQFYDSGLPKWLWGG
jgi:hypothetical protein